MAELTNEEKSAALGGIAFFSGCTDRQRNDIAHLAGERSVGLGEELCHKREFDTHVFVILEGEADASSRGAVIGAVGPGEVVGELAMLGDGHRGATRVLVLDADEVDSVLAADRHSQEWLGPRATRGEN